MTDLRDIGGRLVRFTISVLLAAPLSVGAMLALGSIITDGKTSATSWFALAITAMVFVPLVAVIDGVLARIMARRPRSNLPVARLVRR